MSLTFPSNPTLGDTYTAASNTWYWDGVKWHTQGDQGIIGPSGTAGSAGNDLPKITSVTYADNTYTSNGASSIAPSTAGYVYLTGSNFQSGCKVYVNGTLMTTTYVSGTRVNVAITGQSAASYHIYFYNPDGGTTVKANGLSIVSPPSTSGGTKYNSGSYTIHKFTTSDTFILSGSSITADILVIAGGGSGGQSEAGAYNGGSGGGAGGLVYKPNHVFSVGSYTISIGAGGSAYGSTGKNNTNTNGDDSYINGVVTAKGGGKGTYNAVNAISGGSGGGVTTINVSGKYNTASGTQPSQGGDSGTYGFGNKGGDSLYYWGASGGGGAGANGSDVTSNSGSSNGGIGKSYDIDGSSKYYAGGGAGYAASGGSGGGGTGQGGNGGSNTGGGGAGGGGGNPGGNGGSGIVIIRYLT